MRKLEQIRENNLLLMNQKMWQIGPRPIECAVGVMAYNEEANIAFVLESLLRQKTAHVALTEIIVVASGCTDRTVEIARRFEGPGSPVRVLEQPRREGKASAINLFLQHAQAEIVVMVNGDTLPQEDTLERLVEPFHNPEVGMTGGRTIPLNNKDRFMGFAVHLLWDLHDRVARYSPKLGEIVAWRRSVGLIPRETAVDELSIEQMVTRAGYRLVYQPDAVVYNRGPETTRDFLKQRRRIYAGHLEVIRQHGYRPATINNGVVLKALLEGVNWDRRWMLWTAGTVGLEVYGRVLGRYDYLTKKRHTVWQRVDTTKVLTTKARSVRQLYNDRFLLILSVPHYSDLQQMLGRNRTLQLLNQLKHELQAGLRQGDKLISYDEEGTFALIVRTSTFGIEKIGNRLTVQAEAFLARQSETVKNLTNTLICQATPLPGLPVSQEQPLIVAGFSPVPNSLSEQTA